MAVKEWNDEIVFVRQVTPGASGKSFGIQVARLAGLPDGVVNRAKEILSTLESEILIPPLIRIQFLPSILVNQPIRKRLWQLAQSLPKESLNLIHLN